MRSHRLHERTAHSALRPRSGISKGEIAIRIAAPDARTAPTRAALLGSVCIGVLTMLVPGAAHAVDGTWTGPGGEWTTGTNWSSSPTVPDGTASFVSNGAPTAVTISNSTAINTIDFAAAAPAYSFTVQNGATFTVDSTSNSSSFRPDFSVSGGATLAIGNGGTVEIGALAGAGNLQLGATDPNTLLFIAGSTSTTFSGVISGPGSIELDDAATLRLTGTGSVIGGDLDLCLCSTGSLTIDGGSLTVNGLAQGVTVEGGTLNVINGATLQVGPATGSTNADLLIASNMLISGPGSTVTVAGGFTGVGVFGPGSLTISNGGVLNSQGGAEVDSFFGGPATVVVTGAGSQWNIGGLGLSVGGGTTGGPGTLTISGGGVVTTNVAFIGDSDDGSSFVLVTGTGSRLKATTGLSIGDGGCGCGPLVGTLTIADGGVVEAADTRILAGSTLRLGTGALGGTLMTPTILNDGAIVADFTDGVTLSADISGSGTLSKAGTGKLILSGNSSYSGGTTVTGGTLSMTNGNAVGTGLLTLGSGTTLQLDGTFAVANNIGIAGLAQFDVTAGNTATVNGGIVNALASPAPPGALEKTGTGTLVLSGVNTYSGGTVISAGILRANNAGAIGAGAVTLNGGTFQAGANALNFTNAFALNSAGGMIDTNGFALTISGNITNGTGAGPLIKTGAGTLTLAGSSTYTGATGVNAGTLQAGATNTFAPNSAFTVASGATLNLNNFNQAIGSLAGAGNVTLGSATLTTGNDNTSTIFSGAISGTGSLTKVGSGTLTLAGASDYSGGTTLAGGTLRLANNQALGTGALTTTGSVVDYANGVSIANPIVINSNTTQLQVTAGSATQAGVISELNGPRPLEKIGAGILVLSAANTYSGPTTVSGGALVVTGSIANSGVTVDNGAVLTGTGTVGATTVMSGGTFAPGSGTPGSSMTIAGNLAFQSGALYLVQVNPSSASGANVTAGGTATLAGTVQAAFASGSYVARTYTILSAAGGLGGTTFNTLTTNNLPAGFTASLSYTANDVILNLTATLGQQQIGSGGLSINQRNVANSLNNFFNNGGTLPPGFVNVFAQTGANLGNALSQLSGEAATGGQQAAFQMTNQFLGLMLDPFVDGRNGFAVPGGPALAFAPEREAVPNEVALAYAAVLKAPPVKAPSFEQRWSAWGGAYGGGNRTSGDPAVLGSHDLTASTAGFASGLDYRVTPDTVVGVALAGGGTSWSLANGLGGGRSDAFQAGLYGATRWGAAYVAAALSYTHHWMSTDRFAFASDHLTASFNAQSLGARVESGYRFATMFGGLTPYAAVQAQNFRTPSYRETDGGGGFGLAYNGRTGTDTRSEIGARFDRLLALNPSAVLTLRARLAWAHDWVSDPVLAAAFQTLPGASFIVNGATPARNSALASVGTELRLANGFTLIGKFDGEFAGHSTTYAGTGTIRYAW